MSSKAEWRSVTGFPGYEASSDGHVRSLDRHILCKNGVTIHKPSVVLAEMVQSGKGYKRVNVYRNKRMEQHGVHCLVARAFYGEPDGRQVNHIDFNVTNNDVRNLEYVTPAENTQHSARHGRIKRFPGESNPMAILTENQVREIRIHSANGIKDRPLSEMFGVCTGTITSIRLKKHWKHIA